MDTAGWQAQLRKGAAELVVLSILGRGERYGLQILEETGQAGGVVSDGSLYPLLNRLERDGKLAARWSLDEGVSHPRKYYRLTPDGERLLGEMRRMWAEFRTTISSIVEREP